MTPPHRVQLHASMADAVRGTGPLADAATDLFSTQQWFENLERHGNASEDVVQVLRVDGASGTLLLPLLRRPRGSAAVYGPELASLSNFYSSLYGPVGADAACTVDACRAAVRHLSKHGGAAVVDLKPLAKEGTFFTHILQALRLEGYLADSYFCFGNWYLEVDGRRFAEFYDLNVPSRIRNTIRRGRKKLDDAGAWDLRIETTDVAGLEQAIADFDAIYRKSWKVPEPFPNFVPNLIRTAARLGWLRLGVVRLGSVPIAAQLWLVRGGRALIYKLAYDEAYKRYSAGSVLTYEMMRWAIDNDRVTEVDYLTGDDAYKADWMSHRRERVGIVAFDPRTLQGLISAARHFGARWRRRRRPAAATTQPIDAEDAAVGGPPRTVPGAAP